MVLVSTAVLTNDLASTSVTNCTALSTNVAVPAVNADRTISCTPAAEFHGTDTCFYSVCGASTPPPCGNATVIITVESRGDHRG